MMRTIVMVAAGTALLSCLGAGSASALTSKECSVKYQAAKQAGTLGAQKWADFRKAECGTGASPSASAAPRAPVATATPAPAATVPSVARAAPAPASTVGSSAAAYPSALDPKYVKESAGKARMHTCLDAYKAAKASGTLGSSKWIEKGGGYYSACNAHLKGA